MKQAKQNHSSGAKKKPRPAAKKSTNRPSGGQKAANRPASASKKPVSRPAAAADKRPPAAAPSAPTPRREPAAQLICGKNAVLEALRAEQPINRVLLAENLDRGFAAGVVELCAKHGVPYRRLSKLELTKIAGEDHRGVAAELAAAAYVALPDLLAAAAAKNEPPLLVLLDDIEDPQNLGAILRTALCAGAHGLVVPKRRAAALTATVARVSAGAVAHLPVARVANLNQAVEELKRAGLWIAAADAKGQPLWQADLRGPLALVFGNEGKGIAPLLRKNCDFAVAIPLKGPLDSLNVGAAAAVLLYEVVRQRELATEG